MGLLDEAKEWETQRLPTHLAPVRAIEARVRDALDCAAPLFAEVICDYVTRVKAQGRLAVSANPHVRKGPLGRKSWVFEIGTDTEAVWDSLVVEIPFHATQEEIGEIVWASGWEYAARFGFLKDFGVEEYIPSGVASVQLEPLSLARRLSWDI